MTTTKKTMRDFFVAIREHFEAEGIEFEGITNSEMLEFLDKHIEQIDKKRAASANGEKKMTETQKANEVLKVNIVKAMANLEEAVPVSYMLKNFECCAELSSSKVTSMLNQLVKAGTVTATKAKGQNAYTLA